MTPSIAEAQEHLDFLQLDGVAFFFGSGRVNIIMVDLLQPGHII